MRFPTWAGLVLGAAASLLAVIGPADASDAMRTITVGGQGEARGVPNQAQLSTGVSTVAATADAALADNARKMMAVFAALKRLGVPERAIQTSNFSVQPQFSQDNRGDGAPRMTGYLVSDQVDVTLDDTKMLGPTLDALVNAGANQINSVGFDISDPAALQMSAREAAIGDALQRARTYARAAGVTVGAVVSIQENSTEPPQPIMFNSLKAKAITAVTATAAGELSITASVTVTFELK